MIWLRRWLGIANYGEQLRLIREALELIRERQDCLESRQNELSRFLGESNKHEQRICTLELRTDPNQELVLARLNGLDVVTSAHADEIEEIRESLQELRRKDDSSMAS